MKIVLIGKNGLLGNELLQQFSSQEKCEFIGLDHGDLDITNKEEVFALLKDLKPNLVINAAGFTYVDECQAKKDFVMNVNGTANEHLAEICKHLDSKLMYFSTDYVFDGQKKDGYFEDDTPSPINVYGESKLLGEQLIQQHTDMFYIIRTSWLFGMKGNNFVKTMLDLAKDKKEISVVDDQIGNPTFTVDLAESIKDFILNQQYEHGIYHLVNENTTSWYDFAENIFDFSRIHDINLNHIKSHDLDRPAMRPQISKLHNTKLPKMRSHLEALKDYLQMLNII